MEKNSTLSLASDHQSRIHTYFRMGLLEQSALLLLDNRFMDELIAFLDACPCKAPPQPLRTAMAYSRALRITPVKHGAAEIILN